MRTYSFADAGSVPLYEYLYRCIKKDISEGALPCGEKLPSKRSFAKNLGVSVITVETAYDKLNSEGYIYSVPKRGYFVTDLKEYILPKASQPAGEIVQSAGVSDGFLVDFSSNQTPSSLFPFTVWAKLMREVLHEEQEELMTTSPGGGVFQLRQAIAEHLKGFRGMNVSPEQIVIGAGTEYLYGLLIQLLGMDKRYAVEDPGYRKIPMIYQSHSVACDFVSMDAYGVRTEELVAKRIDVMHISPSHHFPTGTVMPVSRRYELLSWASGGENRYIIEDDYDSELRLGGKPIPTLQSIDVSEKVIYMNTFTKTLSPTIRISYMVLPRRLLETYCEKLSFYACTVSNFEQYTLAKLIGDGYFEKHINRMRNHYHRKRDLLVNAIAASPLHAFVRISKEDAGLHFLMEIRTKLSDTELVERLGARGVRLAPLSGYYALSPENTEHIFVMNYSSLREENIGFAVEQIYACCQGEEGKKTF